MDKDLELYLDMYKLD